MSSSIQVLESNRTKQCAEQKVKTHWHVLYTMPKREKFVAGELKRLGIESFLPLQVVYRQWSDRKKRMEMPLFPSYVFVNASHHDLSKALYITSVVRCLSISNKPVILSPSEISRIRELLNHNPTIVEEPFKAGDFMKITSGSLAGLEGQVVQRKGKTRFSVKINSIQQHILVDIDMSQLERIHRTK